MASARKGSSSTINTRIRSRCYEPAHIVGISKTRYVLATPRCLDWRHDLPRTSTNNHPSDSQGPRRRPAGRHRGDHRRPRLPVLASSSSTRRITLSTSCAVSTVVRSDEAGGDVPDGVTVFDDEFPAVANLDPTLLGALRQAATDAADDGVEFHVTSGWRSPAYQEQLLREAVSEYGSEEEAARWVATPETSPHVSGNAVDIGPSDAAAWLSEHGAEYGLCQIYSNEPWHYELRPEAVDDGCPRQVRRPYARSKDAAVTCTLALTCGLARPRERARPGNGCRSRGGVRDAPRRLDGGPPPTRCTGEWCRDSRSTPTRW